jgi:hypothetical protein
MPNIIEGLPSPFSERTFKKTVLRGFGGLFCAKLARGKDPHALKLGAYRQAPV